MDMHAPYYPADRYRLWDNLSQTDLPQKDPDEWRSLKKNLSVPELKSLYDAEMRSADDRIGTIIHRLKEENRYRESLIIITADHGEMFGEHGHPNLTGAYMAEHSGPPFQELIHVPLIIKLPRNMFAGTTVTQPVRHLDVVPTMLEVLAIPQAAIDPMGTSLIPAITGQQLNVTVFAAGSRMDWLADPEEAEQQWGSFDPQFRAYWGIKSGAWKYIGKSFCMGGDNTSKLFNLKKDPTEQQNVVHSYPETAADLRQSLCQVYKQGRPVMKAPSDFPANVDVPSNIREMLEDLGYLQ